MGAFLYAGCTFQREHPFRETNRSKSRVNRQGTFICSISKPPTQLRDAVNGQYVDLHSLKTVQWTSGGPQYSSGNEEGGGVESETIPEILPEFLFTGETLPLSESQRLVVHSLLTRRSVIFQSSSADSVFALLTDLSFRAKCWGQAILFCSCSRHVAEITCSRLSIELGAESHCQLVLDVADSDSRNEIELDSTSRSARPAGHIDDPPATTYVTTLDVLIRNDSLFKLADLYIFDIGDELADWEEILLSLPSESVILLLTKDMKDSNFEALLVWFKALHGNVVPVINTCQSEVVQDESTVPEIYLYNAAVHSNPVQVYLPPTKNTAGTHSSDVLPVINSNSSLMVEKPNEHLKFSTTSEGSYADLVGLLNSDRMRTAELCKGLFQSQIYSKKRTVASEYVSKTLRNLVFKESSLFPVVVLVHGSKEASIAANSLLCNMNSSSMFFWEDIGRDHLHSILCTYAEQHESHLGDEELQHLSYLAKGVGIVHCDMLPSLKELTEQVFAAGLISVLFVDSFFGAGDINNLPSAKCAVLESSVLSDVDDSEKGLLCFSTVQSLVRKSDSSKIVVLWYDEGMDDARAASELTSFLAMKTGESKEYSFSFPGIEDESNRFWRKMFGTSMVEPNRGFMWSTCSGVLRSLRKFGAGGSEAILGSTLDYHQGRLAILIIQATTEKINLELGALEEQLKSVKWADIALHERLVSRYRESVRIAEATKSSHLALHADSALQFLRKCEPGIVVGMRKPISYAEFESNSDTAVSRSHGLKESIVPAVFIALVDLSHSSKWSLLEDAPYAMLCVLTDGVWGMISIRDLVARSTHILNIVPVFNLDEIPHPASFEIDNSTGRGKLMPRNDSDKLLMKQLIDGLEGIANLQFDLISSSVMENIQSRASKNLELLKSSSFFGKEKELELSYKLRGQAADLRHNAACLTKSDGLLKQAMKEIVNSRKSSRARILAVLEDSNAICVPNDGEVEMTPMGALASILPCRFPLFTASCVIFVDGVNELSPTELVAFIALIVGPDNGKSKSDEKGELGQLLPANVVKSMKDVMQAVTMLHRRHMTSISERLVPLQLASDFASAALRFVSGEPWKDVEESYIGWKCEFVRELEMVSHVISILKDGGALGEVEQGLRRRAESAAVLLERWPVADRSCSKVLTKEGILRKQWDVTLEGYQQWWSNYSKGEKTGVE